ncbi:hypothetical protein ABT093_13530 [Kitasatospora sp. NPDC002551]|uniref:hypothetical protein n=1 Tax=Kitasatospora sp. NPDC002551 TaxID=3154539 RepID=UPI00332BCB32
MSGPDNALCLAVRARTEAGPPTPGSATPSRNTTSTSPRRSPSLGQTREACAEQEAALALTHSASVMTRALLAMDTAICLNTDGDPTAAATMAVDVWEHLPKAYRDGLVRTRAEGLRHALSGPAHARLGEALAG